MKVSIPVKKTVTETVELPQLPHCSCQFGMIYYMITENQSVVQVTTKQITYWGPNDAYYGEYLVQAYQAEQCAKKVFDKAVAIAIEGISSVLNPAKGAVTNTMKDPNLQPASEQPAGQATDGAINAAESASQDAAMEVDSEEGTTEG
jgi:hypothetical protein